MMTMANEQRGNLSLKFTAERNRLIINEQKGKIRALLIVAIVEINPIWDEVMGFFGMRATGCACALGGTGERCRV